MKEQSEKTIENEEKKRHPYNKWKFIAFFAVMTGLFAGTRHLFGIEIPMDVMTKNVKTQALITHQEENDTTYEVYVDQEENEDSVNQEIADANSDSLFEELGFTEEGVSDTCRVVTPSDTKPHRVNGVWSYAECFPDIQDVQIQAAKKYGIHPVKDRDEAEKMVKSRKLVNICHSPFYSIDELTHSIPYLVPRAQHLLNTICLNFIDSCQVKGLPIHLPIVTSVLRTTDDVSNLRRGNKNATQNSCHCYGTTVDIAYNKFMPMTGVYNKDEELLRWNEPMKRVLSEVLYDLRNQNQCYVKYERKQGCFHLTCR